MTFVVTEQCIRCKYTDCVEVCPVDCFYEHPDFLAIHPDECIDCGLCEPTCPVDAIKSEDELTDDERIFLDINRYIAENSDSLTEKKPPHPDAQQEAHKENKLTNWNYKNVAR